MWPGAEDADEWRSWLSRWRWLQDGDRGLGDASRRRVFAHAETVGPAGDVWSVGVGEQEVGDRQVVDAAGSVTGERVQGEDVLGVVVGDRFQRRVFAATCLG